VESQILEISTSRSPDLVLGFTTWSLDELEEFVRSRPEWDTLGRETRLHPVSLAARQQFLAQSVYVLILPASTKLT